MKRTALIDALEKLFPAVPSKPLTEEMADFRIADRVLRSTDGQTMVQVTLAEPTGIDCRVPAAPLYRLLSSIASEEVALSLVGSELHVKYGRSKAKYAANLTSGVLDQLPFDVPAERWRPLPDGLLVGLGKCRFSVSKDASRGPICGILLAGGHVVGTDAYRISSFPTAGPIWPEGEGEFVVSTDLTALALKYAAKVTAMARIGDTLYFRAGDDTILAGKSLPGPFPPVDSWLAEADRAKASATFPAEAKESLKRHLDQQADQVALEREVTVEFGGKAVTLTSTDKARYELEETLELAAEVAEPFAFRSHPQILGDILARTLTMNYIQDKQAKFVVFRTDDGFVYLATIDWGKEEATPKA